MLFSKILTGEIMPILVFLHGLLGSSEDWQKVRERLTHYNIESIALDLPAHGKVKQLSVNNFEHCMEYLSKQIKTRIGDRDYILIGYSLGGRLALYYSLYAQVDKSHLVGVIVEGANFGLQIEEEKALRWENDVSWAKRFMYEPLNIVLEDWYQQGVFAHLNETERALLIQERMLNDGGCIGAMLQATSLAKQPFLGTLLIQQQRKGINFLQNFFYFCGEKDLKFQQIARQQDVEPIVIEQAGHNAHKEQPQIFVEKLVGIIHQYF